MADSGIITMEEYGNVRLKLKERMDSDGINRNTLARRIGVRFEVVDKWYRGDVEKLDLDILARICCVLHCTVAICWNITADITAASAAMPLWQAAAKLIKSEVDGD